MPNDNFAAFFGRVILVVKNPRQGIAENCKCFFERDAVLGKIRCRLFPVPFEYQIHSDLDTLSGRGALFLVNLACLILESAAEIEEVTEGQLPAGEEVGSENLVARQGCVHKVLLPLKSQNLHRFSL